jgi:hypothetical protein
MSYGLQITGNDAGGNFTVADTDLSMVNLIVTNSGRGSSFILEGGIQPGDYIFVKRPTAPNEAYFTPVTVEVDASFGMSLTTSVTFDKPMVYSIEYGLNGEVSFIGSAWKWISGNSIYGQRQFYQYSDFVVEMDYFVVRKASTIGNATSENYGMQLITESGEVALDSRSFTSNQTFYIESYLPPANNFRVLDGASSSLNYSSGTYVNLEWSRKQASIGSPSMVDANSISGIYIADTYAYTIDGDATGIGSGGEPTLQIYSSHNAIFAAKLGVGSAPPTDGGDGDDVDGPPTEPDEITGTLNYQSGSSLTEGDTISFDVTTSEVGNYHTRVFRLSGSDGVSGKDFVSVSNPFTSTSETVTLNTYDTNSASQTFDKTFSQAYTGTYTRDRTSSYTRGVDSSYSRDFIGDFIGNYERPVIRTSSYLGNYTGQSDYTRNFTRGSTYTRNYLRTSTRSSTRTDLYTRPVSYLGNYERTTTPTSTRTSTRTGDFTRTFTAGTSYVGNYMARTVFQEGSDVFYMPTIFTAYYTRTRNSTFAGNYTRTRAGSLSYEGNYTRTSTRTRVSSYLGTYTRDRSSAYTRDRGTSSTRVLSFAGEYSRNFAGNYVRTLNYQRTNTVAFTGNYTRDFVGDYVGNFSGNYFRVGSYTGDFVRSFTDTATTFSRNFTRTRVASYTGNYTRDYVGNYVGNFSGNYTRVQSYARNFSRSFTDTTTYAGDFTRTRSSSYVGDYTRVGSYAGDFTRSYTDTTTYARDFTRTRVASYTGNYTRVGSYARNYARSYTANTPYARNFTRTTSGSFTGTSYNRSISYARTFVGNYSRALSYTRTTSPFSYVSSPKHYWVESPDSESGAGDFDPTSGGLVLTDIEVFNGGALVASTVSTQFTNVSYIQNINGTYWHKGTLQNTIGDNKYYSIALSSSIFPPSNTTTSYTRNSTYTRNRSVGYSRTVDYSLVRTSSYIGNYARNYVSGTVRTESYSRNFTRTLDYTRSRDASYTGNYGRNYVNGTVRTEYYTREFTRTLTYNRTSASNFVGNYTRDYAAGTVRTENYSRNFTRTPVYTRTTLTDYVGNYSGDGGTTFYMGNNGEVRVSSHLYTRVRNSSFTGNYARNYVSGAVRTENYTRTSTRNLPYTRTRITDYVGNYAGAGSAFYIMSNGESRVSSHLYTRTRNSSYIGDYTRVGEYNRTRSSVYARSSTRVSTYTASYLGNYARDFTGNYVGDYTRGYAGDYVGDYSRTRTAGVSYIGDFSGTRNLDYTGNYARGTTSTFTRTRTSAITRTSVYTGTRYFAGDFIGNYVGDYTRDRASTLSYSRPLTFAGNFTGEYSRTSTNNALIRTSSYSRFPEYTREPTADFTRTIISTRTSTGTRTSSYTRTDGVDYTRDFTANYVGDYIGNYTSESTRTPSNTSETGWQGERFVIELRRGSDATSIGAARGTLAVLDSKEFTLYDDDHGLFVSTSPQVIHHTSTTHDVTFDFYTEGTSLVPARIYRGSSIIVSDFNLSSNQRTTKTVNEVPPAGSSYTYSLRVWNGNAWIVSSYYVVSRISNTDYVPPTTTYTPTYTSTYTPPVYYTNTGGPNNNLN